MNVPKLIAVSIYLTIPSRYRSKELSSFGIAPFDVTDWIHCSYSPVDPDSFSGKLSYTFSIKAKTA
jgi:hypothetical protein